MKIYLSHNKHLISENEINSHDKIPRYLIPKKKKFKFEDNAKCC